jgi:hypothetical protein
MNQNPVISDDPLPIGQLVDQAVNSQDPGAAQASAPHHESLDHAVTDHMSTHLSAPHLNSNQSSYGLSDPASLAAAPTLELHDPDLQPAISTELVAPIWMPPTNTVTDAAVAKQTAAPPLSQQPSVLTHFAQVGLTSSDQWEEQIQPRIQKLNDDIAQVHVQLDQLERKKHK